MKQHEKGNNEIKTNIIQTKHWTINTTNVHFIKLSNKLESIKERENKTNIAEPNDRQKTKIILLKESIFGKTNRLHVSSIKRNHK